ncbi:hypothetical protein BD779DRAFT_534829 [Infundibulicybe gibba]|nr:hypothetical protein BD779DRAFT_534829 [Infundibulicybe gibba]
MALCAIYTMFPLNHVLDNIGGQGSVGQVNSNASLFNLVGSVANLLHIIIASSLIPLDGGASPSPTPIHQHLFASRAWSSDSINARGYILPEERSRIGRVGKDGQSLIDLLCEAINYPFHQSIQLAIAQHPSTPTHYIIQYNAPYHNGPSPYVMMNP